MESSDLSIRLDVEPMTPVTVTPAVQGRTASDGEEDKPRRRPPPPEQAEEPEQQDGDRPHHRIDSLA